MKKSSVWFASTALLLLLAVWVAPLSFAQQDQPADSRSGSWTIGLPIQPETGYYASASVVAMEDIPGTITAIEDMPGVKDGMQMRLKTTRGDNYLIWLGPRWFIENQRMKLNVGDEVQVRARKFQGFTYVATEVSKGDLTMRLRNEEDGLPSWECCYPRKYRRPSPQ